MSLAKGISSKVLSEKRISGHRTGTEPGNSGYSQRVVPLYSAKLDFSFEISLSMKRLATESTDLSLRVRFLSRFVGAGEVRRQDKRQVKFAALSRVRFVLPLLSWTVA